MEHDPAYMPGTHDYEQFTTSTHLVTLVPVAVQEHSMEFTPSGSWLAVCTMHAVHWFAIA